MALPLSTNMPDARPLPYENIRILDPSRSAPLASIKDTNAMPREAAKMIIINDTDTLQLMMSYMCHDEPYVQDRSSLQSNLFCASPHSLLAAAMRRTCCKDHTMLWCKLVQQASAVSHTQTAACIHTVALKQEDNTCLKSTALR